MLFPRARRRARPNPSALITTVTAGPDGSPGPIAGAPTRRGPLPRLPPELWARILSCLTDPRHLCAAAHVCAAWNAQIASRHHDAVWHAVWASRGVPDPPIDARVPGLWRDQVAASYRLAALPSRLREHDRELARGHAQQKTATAHRRPRHHHHPTNSNPRADASSPPHPAPQPLCAIVPPPADARGRVAPTHRIVARPRAADLDALLGPARHVHALATGVVLFFERGIGLLVRPPAPARPAGAAADASAAGAPSSSAGAGASSAAASAASGSATVTRPTAPVFHYIVHADVANIVAVAAPTAAPAAAPCRAPDAAVPAAGPAAPVASLVALTGRGAVVQVRVSGSRGAPLRHRVLDAAPLPPVSGDAVAAQRVALSDDGEFALAAFAGGMVRVVSVRRATLAHVFSLPEGVDMVAASSEYAAASNATDPLALSAWRLSDGVCVAAFSATSVGWAGIARVAGLCTTRRPHVFAVLDAADVVRLLDVECGEFVRAIDVSRPPGPLRGPPGEIAAAGVAGVPGGSLFRLADGRGAAASAHEIALFDLEVVQGRPSVVRRLRGARHALFAMATDLRVAVTAERDVFGGLATAVVDRPGLGDRPGVKVWDVSGERVVGEITLPGRATGVSVCGDVLGVVCGKVGQAVVYFAL